MATRRLVIVSDALDGSEDAETIGFSIDGLRYEIDLGAENRARLHKALAPYIERGRRVPAVRGRRGLSGRGSGVDNSAVRAWAKSEGLQVSERGRISADVIRQYEAEH